MTRRRLIQVCALLAACALLLAACGSSSKSSSSTNSAASGTGGGGGGAGALSGEAKSAATGDIPDTQNFLTYKNAASGYSMSYPEGWAQTGSGKDVTIRDKNNIVHITTSSGPAPTKASVSAGLASEKARTPSLSAGSPQTIALKGAGQAIKVTYTTESAPNPVTGKRVKLMVDRYAVAKGGKVATIDLGTPVGVDNVDAYRMMANSFRWQ